MAKNTPSFNSPALQKAFEQAKDSIEHFYDHLDAMSEDIKGLEKWLSDSGLKVAFSMSLDLTDHPGKAWLGWEEETQGGRWRLLFTERIETGDGPTGGTRPLIEMPAETRKDVYPFLPYFLAGLSEKVRVAPLGKLSELAADEIDLDKAIEDHRLREGL